MSDRDRAREPHLEDPTVNPDLRSRQPPGRRRLLGTLGGIFLGAVLLVAAWAKLLDPLAFAEQIRTEGLDVLLSAHAVALIALALEVGLGLALVLGLRRLWVLIPTSVLVAFFLFLTGRTYYLASQGLLEETNSCGCFGNLVQRTPAEAFWQDLALLVPALILAWIGRASGGRAFPPLRTALVGLATAGALIFAWKAPQLPLDDLATRLHPGVEVSGLCTGSGETRTCFDLIVPELRDGRHLVVMAELKDEEARREISEIVPRLNEYALGGTGPHLWVVAEVTPETLNQLFWQWGPAFEIRQAPASLLRPLYRTLPRSFLVEDGTVVETYRGLPPLEELADGDRQGQDPS